MHEKHCVWACDSPNTHALRTFQCIFLATAQLKIEVRIQSVHSRAPRALVAPRTRRASLYTPRLQYARPKPVINTKVGETHSTHQPWSLSFKLRPCPYSFSALIYKSLTTDSLTVFGTATIKHSIRNSTSNAIILAYDQQTSHFPLDALLLK